MIRITERYAHIIGAMAAVLTAFAVASVFYDYAMPVVAAGSLDHALTPIVEPGEDLIIAYKGVAIRQCPTENLSLTMIDSLGVEYKIVSTSLKISIISDDEASVAVPVPKQIAPGTARFNLSYDKVCSVLVLFRSTHQVNRPSVSFIVKETA